MDATGRLKIKVQVIAGEAIAMGPGKADLMEAIERTGSIAAAGRAMGLSYRRTRDLVDTLNTCWRAPLIATSRGGAGHGGAALTEEGRAVLASYRRLTEALEAEAARHAAGLMAPLREPGAS